MIIWSTALGCENEGGAVAMLEHLSVLHQGQWHEISGLEAPATLLYPDGDDAVFVELGADSFLLLDNSVLFTNSSRPCLAEGKIVVDGVTVFDPVYSCPVDSHAEMIAGVVPISCSETWERGLWSSHHEIVFMRIGMEDPECEAASLSLQLRVEGTLSY